MGTRRLRMQESPCETYKLCGGVVSTKWEFVISGPYELNEECKLVKWTVLSISCWRGSYQCHFALSEHRNYGPNLPIDRVLSLLHQPYPDCQTQWEVSFSPSRWHNRTFSSLACSGARVLPSSDRKALNITFVLEGTR